MTKLVLKKALVTKRKALKKDEDAQQLEKFRKLILDHLDTLEDEQEEKSMQKAFSSMIRMEKGGKGLPVGTVREWKGKRFKKIAPGKWRPAYDNETRGAKMAISAIKKKIASAPDAHTMMQIILENRDRFSDKNGQPLPFVQEFSKYVAERGDTIEAAAKKEKGKTNHKSNYMGGSREQRLHRVKDDYAAGKIDFETTVKEYMAIYPKLSKEAAEKTVRGQFDPPIKKGEAVKRVPGSDESPAERGEAFVVPGYDEEKMKAAARAIREKIESGASDDDVLKAAEEAYNEEPEKTDDRKSDFEKIQEKYKNAVFEEGDEDEIQIGKELISGKWKLVEADTPAASHDETNFNKTPGFPTTDDGSTINDRDYGHDREAQEIVMEIGADYDGRAVSVDNPVIITKDGIVISGNNRTMSSKIAARKGTDTGYIEALKRKAKKFGFTSEQVDKFKHPRIIFETAENKGYSTDQFAKFNKSSKKAMSPLEYAVKISKTIKTDTVESIAGKMSDFETLGELHADRNVVNDIFNTFQRDNIISAMDRPQYVVDSGITGAGKEFLETVLIGSVINENNIRGLNREGCKSIRQKLVRAITPLIENKGMNGYSITKELNEAVDIAIQVAIQKDKFKSVDDYANQKNLFGIEDDPVSVEIARKLEGTQKEFAAFMQSMNGGLKYAANGEADIFLGSVESREDILYCFSHENDNAL
jgi:hypothetical protein